MRSLLAEVSRLANLSEQLLDLHRLDNGAPTERIDLTALACGVVADLAPVLIASKKTIEVTVDKPGVMVVGHAGSIERVLTNLVQNAVEHRGDAVVVRIDGAAFEVQDNGPGIAARSASASLSPSIACGPAHQAPGWA